MIDREINIAIAEACGWKDLGIEDFSEYGVPVFMLIGANKTGTRLAPPDYCNDLNAMHDAERTLSGFISQSQYAATLYHVVIPKICKHRDDFIDWVIANGLIRATARQRAEAFLRTIGKWKEEVK